MKMKTQQSRLMMSGEIMAKKEKKQSKVMIVSWTEGERQSKIRWWRWGQPSFLAVDSELLP